jgi:Na+:H+ antiporter, NhaC family
MKEAVRKPSLLEAILGFVLILGVIIVGIWFKVGMQTPIIFGTIAAALVALYLGNKWDNIQEWMIKGISYSMVANIILVLSGMLVGLWILGGTVPTLIYYGLKLISPSIFLPMTFLICIATSLATGTSFGTISTVGIALLGVSIGLGLPAPMTVGAVVSGAFFGDKMSPISDTTNIAPAMAGANLFDHIGSMLWTTIPAAVISLILYTILGSPYGAMGTDMVAVEEIMSTINSQFNVSLITLLPPLLLLILSFKRVPAIPTLVIVVLFSMILPILTQGAALKGILASTMHGYSSTTGLAVVDKILSRGGITMMTDSIVMILAATAMGGILDHSGIMEVILSRMLKSVKTYKGLIPATLLSALAVVLATGNMVLGSILVGRTFKDAYKKMNIHPKVLSRSLEDVGTLTNSIIPWGGACIFIQAVMDIDLSYIPYAFLNYLTPCISMIFGLTGIAIWTIEGKSVLMKKDTTLTEETA